MSSRDQHKGSTSTGQTISASDVNYRLKYKENCVGNTVRGSEITYVVSAYDGKTG